MQGDVLGFIKNRPGNLIINGAMDFNQRNSSAIGMDATPDYRVQDRFLTYTTVNTDWNTRNQDVGSLLDSKGITWKALSLILNAATVNATAFIEQRIESSFSKNVAGKKASFAVEFVNPGFTDLTIKVYRADVEDDHSAQTLIDSKSESFTADSTVKKMKFENIDIPASAEKGIAIVLEVSGITIGSNTTNSFSKMMFNEGPVVGQFERAGSHIANEFQFCQRYLWRISGSKTAILIAAVNNSTNTNTFVNVKMRQAPVPSFQDLNLNDAGIQSSVTNIALNQFDPDRITLFISATGLTAGRAAILNSASTGFVQLDAEL